MSPVTNVLLRITPERLRQSFSAEMLPSTCELIKFMLFSAFLPLKADRFPLTFTLARLVEDNDSEYAKSSIDIDLLDMSPVPIEPSDVEYSCKPEREYFSVRPIS